MKTIIILQNSYLSFGLDAAKIYQPNKYRLYLIVNDFCNNILKLSHQEKFYDAIVVTNDFSFENILEYIIQLLNKSSTICYDLITNSEETMPVCGELRKFLKLDTENYSRFYNKDIMKKRLIGCSDILVPKYIIFDYVQFNKNKEKYLHHVLEQLTLPIFVKPIDACGAVNTQKIKNYSELLCWALNMSPEIIYELDEFIEGTMYHCDSYIQNEKILFTFVSENSRPCYNFTVGEMKGTIVLPDKNPDACTLSDITEKTLCHLGLPKGGVTHFELIKTLDNKIYFIEVAHRSPGCLIPKMYLLHADIDTVAAHFLLQIDSEFKPTPKITQFTAWACYPKKPGVVMNLSSLPDEIDSHYEIEWFVRVGDKIDSFSKFGRDYTGTIFMINSNFEKLYFDFKKINNHDLCKIEAG